MPQPRPSAARHRLPNFFVIGANRAGTTSLYNYLSQHPAVFMSPIKEPNFFAPVTWPDDPQWPNRQEPVTERTDYEALFAGVTQEVVVGESSTAYLASKQTPALIHDAVPEAKLVAILRDPVERAFSDWSLHRSWNVENLSFADAVRAELAQTSATSGRLRGYVMGGFYGRHLSRYLELFDRSQVRICLYEDLDADPARMLRDVFTFLDVDPSFDAITTARHNASRHQPRSAAIDRAARAARSSRFVRQIVPPSGRARVRELLRRRNALVPELPIEVRGQLIDVYRDDIELTAQIIDRDLSAWLSVRPRGGAR